MEIVKERLEREHNLDLIITNPSTDYQVITTSGQTLDLKRASELPDPTQIVEIKEPWINGEIVVPKDYLGRVLELVVSARGIQKNISYLDSDVALISFEAPLANMLTDFYDKLKSSTSGYGSFNYDLSGYRTESLVKLDLLVSGEVVDSLSQMVHKTEAQFRGREYVARMKEVIPRQLFEVALQAAIGGKIIAREDIKALGKNVTGHLYGGDVSRKKKLWAKQKRGKARMKKFGKVEIPAEAFSALLQRKD
jgi:GTP-binding protein LepA